MKKMSKDEALDYCFNNISHSKLEKAKYHKYREYKRRHNKGQLLRDTAIHAMFNDFGIRIDCHYYLDELDESKAEHNQKKD